MVRTWYVLFTPSTYQVRTSQISMYLVRTEYRKHDKSAYFRLKVQTSMSYTSTYWYVLSTYFFAYSCTDLSSFRKGTYLVHADSRGVRTFGSWFYCAPAGQPTGLLASNSGTGPRIEQSHTKALAGFKFIHCCLAAPLTVPELLGAGAGGLLGDSALAGQLHPIRRRHDQLSAHQQHQPATQWALWMGVWRTWALSWGVHYELQKN